MPWCFCGLHRGGEVRRIRQTTTPLHKLSISHRNGHMETHAQKHQHKHTHRQMTHDLHRQTYKPTDTPPRTNVSLATPTHNRPPPSPPLPSPLPRNTHSRLLKLRSNSSREAQSWKKSTVERRLCANDNRRTLGSSRRDGSSSRRPHLETLFKVKRGREGKGRGDTG